ncbi:MAG: AbrB family transcriptional regulator [Proteobacteria bacterium]|nr:AbrB family transcriptional regulator [Pseudomonadota bacterium]MDA1356648.1 AbrB family transcriptional regulator [Pseudomonadota bacterium]
MTREPTSSHSAITNVPPPAPGLSQKNAAKFLLALALGAVGGAVFYMLGLPLPWMLGAMSLVTIAAISGVPLASWPRFRNGMVAVLGVLLGSQFNADIFARIADWYVGLAGVAVSGSVMVALCTVYYRKLGGYDRTSAYFSAIPGGLSEMMVLGEAMGGDARRISLSHAVRILTAVFLIAFYFRLFEGYQPVGLVGEEVSAVGWRDSLILVACAIVGWPAARLLRIPAAQLVGPLALSAGAHLSGLVSAMPPGEIVAAAQVALGAAIGARFVGARITEIWRIIVVSIGAAIIMVAIAAIFAFVLGEISGSSKTALFLALAPGGLAEMSIIALSFGTAAAFVSTHHIVRIILLVVIAPAIFKYLYMNKATNPKGR